MSHGKKFAPGLWATRYGQLVRLYTVGGGGNWPIHGAVERFDQWWPQMWNAAGGVFPHFSQDRGGDLFCPWKEWLAMPEMDKNHVIECATTGYCVGGAA